MKIWGTVFLGLGFFSDQNPSERANRGESAARKALVLHQDGRGGGLPKGLVPAHFPDCKESGAKSSG